METPRFNVVLPTQSFAETREFATRAEAVGYDAVAVEDHFFMRSPMAQPGDPRLECFTALTAVAMLTRRVKLAQLVACNSYRHPAMTAKIAASLDHVSGVSYFFLRFTDLGAMQAFGEQVIAKL